MCAATSKEFPEDSVEHRILSFARENITGCTDKDLQAHMPDIEIKDRAKAINSLLQQG